GGQNAGDAHAAVSGGARPKALRWCEGAKRNRREPKQGETRLVGVITSRCNARGYALAGRDEQLAGATAQQSMRKRQTEHTFTRHAPFCSCDGMCRLSQVSLRPTSA